MKEFYNNCHLLRYKYHAREDSRVKGSDPHSAWLQVADAVIEAWIRRIVVVKPTSPVCIVAIQSTQL
jgi:hypothetical protein